LSALASEGAYLDYKRHHPRKKHHKKKPKKHMSVMTKDDEQDIAEMDTMKMVKEELDKVMGDDDDSSTPMEQDSKADDEDDKTADKTPKEQPVETIAAKAEVPEVVVSKPKPIV